ncbi:hypothetical protein HDV02_003795 [Globomyces sp. JEL0801]|nr:hypothetical protein HDV02_002196 [Globomyces sp. JEL0801]KAJ2998957.1 hypothetical protein HDV02_003795 [Globomyces sp. JEL0801]
MVSFTNLLLLSATALAMPAKPQVCTPVLRDHQTTGLGSKAVETINQVILPAFRKKLVTNGVAWVLSYQSNTKNKVEQTELVRAVAHLTGEKGLVFLTVECKENPKSYMTINTAIN